MFRECDDLFVLLFPEILAIVSTTPYLEMRLHIYAATDHWLPRKKKKKERKKNGRKKRKKERKLARKQERKKERKKTTRRRF